MPWKTPKPSQNSSKKWSSMARREGSTEYPIDNKKISDKIRDAGTAGKRHKQILHYALIYAESALSHYWRYIPDTEGEQQVRRFEINRWETAIEWHNAGVEDRLITALSQDANHLRHAPERDKYELGVALGNIAGFLIQQSGSSAETTHP